MGAPMQVEPVNLIDILEHAACIHGDGEVVSRLIEDNSVHRTTYGEILPRTKQLANALKKLGVEKGDRVATLAWNGYRHVESWFAIFGQGAVYHTLNPRLHPDQLIYIINHAEDRFLLTDLSFVPILEKIAKDIPTIEGYIIMTDRAHMPETSLDNVYCYEELLAAEAAEFNWPRFPEDTPSGLCYTSGTTGNPKGVMYTHRSIYLHSLAVNSKDCIGLSPNSSALVVVPMFHANAWGMIQAAPMCGAKMILPGAGMDGKSIYELIDGEQANLSAAVPTVWTMLLDYMEKENKTIECMEEVIIGGSAAPRSMIDIFGRKYGVDVLHAWGMTEMNPLGTVNRPKAFMKDLNAEEQLDYKCKQGYPPFGVQMKIIDDNDNELPRDGVAFGRLMVKGPWVVETYYKFDEPAVDAEGWFDTGDVATLDQYGLMEITDRAKDVIKSGGEWISSVILENEAVGYPGITIAAVIGIAHPKWEERPLLIVVPKDGAVLEKDAIIAFLSDKVAKWWLPDDVVFVDEIPLTASGKISKLNLRKQFVDYKFPV